MASLAILTKPLAADHVSPPADQGRFRYGPLRGYALLSLARLAPYPVIGLTAFLVWAEISADEEARHILNQIGLSESQDLSQTELDAFWRLATSRDAVRYHFLSDALESPGNATKVNRRADMMAQALTGLDPKRRERIRDDYILPCIQRTEADREIYLACIKLGAALSVSNSEFVVLAIDWLASQFASSERDALSNLLQTVVGRLPGEAAEVAFARIVEIMDKTTDPDPLQVLAGALKAVPGTLDQSKLINLLKWPNCIGEFRSAILERLERQTQQEFHDDVWVFVEWAHSSGLVDRLNLDLSSPPSRELVSAFR